MRKVKVLVFAFAVSGLLWAANYQSDAPPKLSGTARNHTRAVVVIEPLDVATVASIKTAE